MPLRIAHVTASGNFLGLERIILETGSFHQRTKDVEQIFVPFPKGGKEEPFLREIEKAGGTARANASKFLLKWASKKSK